MNLGSPIRFDQTEPVAKIGLNVMGAPWQCYAEAWGVGAKADTGIGNGTGTDAASTSTISPLEAGMGAINKMTDAQINLQMQQALSRSIF